MSLTDAAARWRTTPPTGKNAARLRAPLLTGQLSSETARQTVVEQVADLSPGHRRAVEDIYTRATVQSAIVAPHALGLGDEKLPPRLRRALTRQRLHAGVIGQRPGDQLLTFDGSVSRPSALTWY